jgi:hypothetical protein
MTREAGAGPSPLAALIDGYEALREEAVSGARGRSLGLGLFLREGMAAWMRACATWMPKPAPPSPPSADAALPIRWHGPMAALLADMALATLRESA